MINGPVLEAIGAVVLAAYAVRYFMQRDRKDTEAMQSDEKQQKIGRAEKVTYEDLRTPMSAILMYGDALGKYTMPWGADAHTYIGSAESSYLPQTRAQRDVRYKPRSDSDPNLAWLELQRTAHEISVNGHTEEAKLHARAAVNYQNGTL
jgi:hypothetical protein